MPAAVDLSPLPTASGRGSQHALRSPPTPCAPRGHPNATSTVVLVHGHGARTRHLRSWQFNRRQRAKIRRLSVPHLKPDLAARFSGTMRTRRVAILCHPAGVTAGRAPRSAATLTEHIDLSNVLVLVFWWADFFSISSLSRTLPSIKCRTVLSQGSRDTLQRTYYMWDSFKRSSKLAAKAHLARCSISFRGASISGILSLEMH